MVIEPRSDALTMVEMVTRKLLDFHIHNKLVLAYSTQKKWVWVQQRRGDLDGWDGFNEGKGFGFIF